MNNKTLDISKRLADYRAMVKHLQGPLVEPIAVCSKEERVLHAIVGIADEAGELIGITKAHLWYGKSYSEEHILEEMGDLFHYMTYLMIEYNWTLEDVMDANTEKLKRRYPDGFSTDAAIARADKTEVNKSEVNKTSQK